MKPQTPEQVREALLAKIAVLKRDKPPGWQRTAKALCDKLADLAGLADARPEADQHDQEVTP